ncbi:MT-A70-domain-containing protein [Periconia macrospinosa]|uniref:MT-A70-domain-containing protein n=1 Tax=Periconia macrospinosa TaxID=97972 RepID=A0A2V1DL09_9PLEO|nr:MT-A70-domain-containing protein [Periconia macrospinosa]
MADRGDGDDPSSAILYQSADRSVTLIDIPKSIAAAQGRSGTLLSMQPLDSPIELEYEPIGKKDKVVNARHLDTIMLHSEYKTLIELALTEIGTHVPGPWCKPRKVMARVPKRAKSDMAIDDPEQELHDRLREWAQVTRSKGDDYVFDFQKMMASLGAPDVPDATTDNNVARKWQMSYSLAREITSDNHLNASEYMKQPEMERVEEPWMPSFHNPEKHALDLSIFENTAGSGQQVTPTYHFTIPPKVSFFLGDTSRSDIFRASFRELTDEYKLPRHFDLVLIDPPWPNRSAKRSRGYEQTGGMPYIKKMLLNTDIDSYFEHNALVGVWITNKEALRMHILGPGGLFESWNVGLIEEWIWVKTTTKGQPMFDIDSVTRKPYEVLLLGRAAPNSWTTMAPAPIIKRKVIAAVPDVHSRKPCLKALLEEYMPDKDDYSALEVFSRYLVSGWTSWGNEVLKYNNDQYWKPVSDTQST